MSELLHTVAAVFRRKGADEMPASAFKHALSLDLRWFAPADARKLLQHAADVGAVVVDGDRVSPGFDVARVDVPVSFKPSTAALEERPAIPEPATDEAPAAPEAPAKPDGDARTIVGRALAEAAVASGEDPDDLRRAFKEACARHAGVFTEDVVALIVARRHGADVTALAAEAVKRGPDAGA